MQPVTAAEIAYLQELPPEDYEHFGRHHCPVPRCPRTVRYGNVVCGPCWLRIPTADRAEVVPALRQREQRPELWAEACQVTLTLATEAKCRKRRASSTTTTREPESDPASHRRTA